MVRNTRRVKTNRQMMAHEYVNIWCFDSVTKLLFIAELCMYWFNSLVWGMYVLANRDLTCHTMRRLSAFSEKQQRRPMRGC